MNLFFVHADGRTLVEIAEEGWRENQGALGASYGNCQGWTQMQCALKAWLEHGINLREGMIVRAGDTLRIRERHF